MVTLTTVTYLHEADQICQRLEASGIKTLIPDQGALSMNPFLANAIGGLRIQVDEKDLAAAREIVGDVPAATSPGLFTCPRCGSDEVQYERVSRRFAFLSLLLVGVPLLWFKRQCTCKSCGCNWREE